MALTVTMLRDALIRRVIETRTRDPLVAPTINQPIHLLPDCQAKHLVALFSLQVG